MGKQLIEEWQCDNEHCERVVKHIIEPIRFGGMDPFSGWIKTIDGKGFCCNRCARQYYEDKEACDD